MLLRENEAPIFDKTRNWLESNPDNQFHLIVDELHSYRGTQGTEVALVVRNFLDRLGISSSSQQLRCLATSASLDAQTGHEYLEQFFGVDRKTFAIFPGEPREVNQQLPIEKKIIEKELNNLKDSDQDLVKEAKERIYEKISPRETLAAACTLAGKFQTNDNKSLTRPAKLSALKDVIFGKGSSSELLDALFLAALTENNTGSDRWEKPKPTFRSHMFFRQVQGVWACSNPNCSELEEQYKSDERKIGRLFKSPALKCQCGGQVLELLYCYDCGEAFLGGFIVKSTNEDLKEHIFLCSTKPDQNNEQSTLVYERTHDEFRWYWPGGNIPQGEASWSHTYPNSNQVVNSNF